MQTTNRAAARGRGVFIRKMRPFEECRSFASYKYAVAEQAYGVPRAFWWGFFTKI
jgi:hypothetical protein